MVGKMKSGFILAGVAAAVLAGTSAVRANSLELDANNVIVAPIFSGGNLVGSTWTYSAFLTSNTPNVNQIVSTNFIDITGVGTATNINVTGMSGGSDWAYSTNGGGDFILTYTGPTINGALLTPAPVGSFTFDTTDTEFLVTKYNTTDNQFVAGPNGVGGGYAISDFQSNILAPAPSGGTPLPTPLPAAFGPGVLLLGGLAFLGKRRMSKAAV